MSARAAAAFAAAGTPVVVLAWMAVRERPLRVAGLRIDGAVARSLVRRAKGVDGLRVTHVVELHDDILVGYAVDTGSPPPSAGAVAGPLGAVPPPPTGQLLLPGLVRDGQAMRLLHLWHAEQRPLTSVLAPDQGLVGLVDGRSRWAIIAALPPSPGSSGTARTIR